LVKSKVASFFVTVIKHYLASSNVNLSIFINLPDELPSLSTCCIDATVSSCRETFSHTAVAVVHTVNKTLNVTSTFGLDNIIFIKKLM